MPRLRYLYEQKEYRVPLKDRMSIGRASDNDICVPLDSLSRHHAIVSRDAVTGAFTLSDNGSANGVMVKGQRIQFAGADAKVPSGVWQELRLMVRGSHFEVFLDGRNLYGANDATMAGPGKVALWTKADSVTYFDRIAIKTLP